MIEKVEKVITSEEFQSWLLSKKPDEVVGDTVGLPSQNCALARFLTEKLGVPCDWGYTAGGPLRSDSWVSAGAWSSAFVAQHDVRGRVTASEALAILDSIVDPCPICGGDHDRIFREDCPEYVR